MKFAPAKFIGRAGSGGGDVESDLDVDWWSFSQALPALLATRGEVPGRRRRSHRRSRRAVLLFDELAAGSGGCKSSRTPRTCARRSALLRCRERLLPKASLCRWPEWNGLYNAGKGRPIRTAWP